MPSCPRCKERVDSPEKANSVIVEPAVGERGLTRVEVGTYRCGRCDTVFPRVMGRRRYLFVPETEFNRLNNEVESLTGERNDLQKTVEEMKREHLQREEALTGGREKAEIKGLESELKQLERQVEYLREQEEELEMETSS